MMVRWNMTANSGIRNSFSNEWRFSIWKLAVFFCFPFKYFQSIRVTIKILFTTILGKRTKNLRKIRLGKWGMKYISMQGNISVNTFFFFFFFLITDLKQAPELNLNIQFVSQIFQNTELQTAPINSCRRLLNSWYF